MNPRPPRISRPTRLQIALWIAVTLATLALSLYDWDGYIVGTYGDDSSYITNTDSLLRRVPYGQLLAPGEDTVTQFPFLFPIMLAPLRVLFPDSPDAMRVVSLAATLLALAVLFWGWRWIGFGLSYWWGTVVVVLTALSPVTILHARTIMSEAPFMLVSLLLIILVERSAVRQGRAWGIPFGILMFCLLFLRTIGWLFGAIWLGYLVWKCRRAILPQLGVAALVFLGLVGIVLATTTVSASDFLPQEYLLQFSAILRGSGGVRTFDGVIIPGKGVRYTYFDQVFLSGLDHLDFAEKLPYQFEHAIIVWTDAHGLAFLRYVPLLAAAGFLVYGLVRWWRATGLTAFQSVVPPYLLLLIFWTFNGARLWYPIQPQLIIAMLFGLYGAGLWVGKRIRLDGARRWAGATVVALTALVVVASVWLDLNFTRTMLLPEDPRARGATIEQYVPPGAVLLSSRAPSDHLYVARTVIDIPQRLTSTDTLVAFLTRRGADYIASHYGIYVPQEKFSLRVGPVTRFVVAIDPLIKNGALELIYLDEPHDFAIYRVNHQVLAGLQP